jgi:hypothetical protein
MMRFHVALALLLTFILVLPVGAPHLASLAAGTPVRSSAPIVGHPGASTVLPSLARTGTAGSQDRLIVSSTDSAAMPNDGLRLNITPFVEPLLGPDTSFQAAVEETIGNYDAVFGLFTNTATAPIPFFSVFSNTTDATVHLAYWPSATTAPETSYDFELTWRNGTIWELDVNHQIFGGNMTAGAFDFGTEQATWLGGLSFSEIALSASSSSAPATLSAPLAFAVLEPAGWYLPNEAQVTFSPATGNIWGIEGRLQHPTLAPGELVSGTGIPTVANGTELWAGGRVPVDVVVGAPAATRGLTTVAVSITVTTASGAPVPGATVYLSDQLAGAFTPDSVVTGSNGSAQGAFSAPNVTANASDLLSAFVTTFGYDGFTGVAVDLEPAVQVLVIDLSAGATVGPGGSVVLAFATRGLDGTELPGVFLSLVASSGVLSPSFGLTGSDATLRTTLSAPNTTGYVLVRVVVDAGGEWGAGSANVSVVPPTPPLLTTTDLEIVAGLALATIVAVAVILQRRRVARRPPVPPMRFPRRAKVGTPISGGSDDPATRTRPGAGAP